MVLECFFFFYISQTAGKSTHQKCQDNTSIIKHLIRSKRGHKQDFVYDGK